MVSTVDAAAAEKHEVRPALERHVADGGTVKGPAFAVAAAACVLVVVVVWAANAVAAVAAGLWIAAIAAVVPSAASEQE